MKLLFAGAAALSLLAAPASAEIVGPGAVETTPGNFYVYTEVESDWTLGEYDGTTTTARFGYEGEVTDSASLYLEAGPSFINPDGADLTTELGLEFGGQVAVTERLSAYGEVEFITNGEADLNEDLDIGTKAGLLFTF
jgi:hypothetical protein